MLLKKALMTLSWILFYTHYEMITLLSCSDGFNDTKLRSKRNESENVFLTVVTEIFCCNILLVNMSFILLFLSLSIPTCTIMMDILITLDKFLW